MTIGANQIRYYRLVLQIVSLVALLTLSACGDREARGDYPAANGNNCLPEVSLIDQHGSAVSLASLKGKPVLIDFIYTSCASTCPMLTAKMAAIAQKLGPALGADVRIVSISLDPEHDSPAELAKYARSHGASDYRMDLSDWTARENRPGTRAIQTAPDTRERWIDYAFHRGIPARSRRPADSTVQRARREPGCSGCRHRSRARLT